MNAVLKSKLEMQVEHYSAELCDEMLPLIRKNWRESPSYEEGIEADPDFERYRKMDAAGIVLCLTARFEQRLVGYVVLIASFSLHHKTIYCAHGDVIYMEPEFRGAPAKELLLEAEKMMASRGVKRFAWFVDKGSPLYFLLRGCGYRDDEIVMEKVCVSGH